MAEDPTKKPEVEAISLRIVRLQKELESLVANGTEHPRFEMKREFSLDGLDKKLRFVKLVQGLANAHLDEERCLVIGADQRSKSFLAVANQDQFDPAAISDLLSKYLYPAPAFEVFHLATENGIPFTTVVMAPIQPRPIVVKTEGHCENEKIHLRPGDVWIKKNTKLETASREDLDAMYSDRIEKEAEDRARKRFAHLKEDALLAHTQSMSSRSARWPTADLVLGPRPAYRAFIAELLSESDEQRFRMLLEVLRDFLIEHWNAKQGDALEYLSMSLEYYKNSFLPALDCLVETGLLIIKNDGNSGWLDSIGGLLIETFEFSRSFQFTSMRNALNLPDSIWSWRPALSLYVGARCLLIYSIKRRRERFLGSLLRRIVRRFTMDFQSQAASVPFCYWPFSDRLEIKMPDGLNKFCWDDHIEASWQQYFGSYTSYLSNACGLEFILEFNSYVALGYPEPSLKSWVAKNLPNVSFSYTPDLWRHSLEHVIPWAERFYEILSTGSGFQTVQEISIASEPVRMLFEGKTVEQKLRIFGNFLIYLQDWREKVLVHQNRFPGWFNWPEKIDKLIQEVGREKQAQQTGG